MCLVVFLAAGCGKTQNAHIKGTVQNDSSRCLVKGVSVTIYESSDDSFSNPKFVAECTTDINGKFEFIEHLNFERTNFLRLENQNYFSLDYLIDNDENIEELKLILKHR